VLYLYGNYSGDVMNFDLAAELALARVRLLRTSSSHEPLGNDSNRDPRYRQALVVRVAVRARSRNGVFTFTSFWQTVNRADSYNQR